MFDLPMVCDRVVQWGLAALIAFTPLAFGTVEPWALAAMEWGIVTLALAFGLGQLWPTSGIQRPRVAASGVEAPLVAFILLCVLQTIPMPLAWLRTVSPGSFRMYEGVDFLSPA